MISGKLKLIRWVVTPVESHMLMDGWTDEWHTLYHTTTDFCQAYKNTISKDVLHGNVSFVDYAMIKDMI